MKKTKLYLDCDGVILDTINKSYDAHNKKSIININKEMKNEINNDSIDMEMDLIN